MENVQVVCSDERLRMMEAIGGGEVVPLVGEGHSGRFAQVPLSDICRVLFYPAMIRIVLRAGLCYSCFQHVPEPHVIAVKAETIRLIHPKVKRPWLPFACDEFPGASRTRLRRDRLNGSRLDLWVVRSEKRIVASAK